MKDYKGLLEAHLASPSVESTGALPGHFGTAGGDWYALLLHQAAHYFVGMIDEPDEQDALAEAVVAIIETRVAVPVLLRGTVKAGIVALIKQAAEKLGS